MTILKLPLPAAATADVDGRKGQRARRGSQPLDAFELQLKRIDQLTHSNGVRLYGPGGLVQRVRAIVDLLDAVDDASKLG